MILVIAAEAFLQQPIKEEILNNAEERAI